MRAILLIALMWCGCASDSDVAPDLQAVADLSTPRGEYCGGAGQTRCCTTEQAGQPCTNGDSCKVPGVCSGYYLCEAGAWVLMGVCHDMTMPPTD